MRHERTRIINNVIGRGVKYYLKSKFPDDPIIIGGPARSGTTLLLSLIGSHPRVHAIDYETTAFHPNFRPEKLFAALFFENEKRKPRKIDQSKTRFAEKTPGNIRHTREIDAFFNGKVKFLHIYRDGRDVLTSRHPLDPTKYWVSIDRWIRDVEGGLSSKNFANVHSIKYENLVATPEQVIRGVCEFIGEEVSDRMLEYEKHTNVKNALAWPGAVKAFHTGSVKKWERPEHQERLREIMRNNGAVDLLNELGYTL